MPIEGPLRELGIHDVFQLLDLNRKTGALTVTSFVRDNRGAVYFERGAVIHATIRSNPHPLGQLLLRAGKISEGDLARARDVQTRAGEGRRLGEVLVSLGAITPRELERQVRFQVEEVVFELMSWREGFFSFEEREVADAPVEASVRIATESLLMEGARRIDEWSRIEHKVPHVGVVPALAAVDGEHAALLDLLPSEWEVLVAVDGVRDLRAIAGELARSDFDVARTVYGLMSTGVLELRDGPAPPPVAAAAAAAQTYLDAARGALRAGDADAALSAARMAVAITPDAVGARLLLARALTASQRHEEAATELDRALAADAGNGAVLRELGCCAVRRGALEEAAAHWRHALDAAPAGTDAPRLRAALGAADVLRGLLTEDADV